MLTLPVGKNVRAIMHSSGQHERHRETSQSNININYKLNTCRCRLDLLLHSTSEVLIKLLLLIGTIRIWKIKKMILKSNKNKKNRR